MLEIPQLKATSVYYNVFGQIYQYNRKRQDNLNLEKTQVTPAWLIYGNISLLAISVVDNYSMCKECSREDNEG